MTQLRSNRLVSVNYAPKKAVSEHDISSLGTEVHLKGYGVIKVFEVVSKKGDIEYWATNDLKMDELGVVKYGGISWGIEEYHRGLKQFCGMYENHRGRSWGGSGHHFFRDRSAKASPKASRGAFGTTF